MVLSTCPNKLSCFTFDFTSNSRSHLIFEKSFSVPLVKFLQYFKYSEKTFEFCCNVMHLFPNHKNFVFNYCVLNSSQLIVLFVFILYFSHKICFQDITKSDPSLQAFCLIVMSNWDSLSTETRKSLGKRVLTKTT